MPHSTATVAQLTPKEGRMFTGLLSFSAEVFNIYKRTIPALLSYDFSFFIIALGFIIPRVEAGAANDNDASAASALTTTMLSTLAFIVYASHLQASFISGELLGRLRGERESLAQYTSAPDDSLLITGMASRTSTPLLADVTSTKDIVSSSTRSTLTSDGSSPISQLESRRQIAQNRIRELEEELGTLPVNSLFVGTLPTIATALTMILSEQVFVACKQGTSTSAIAGHFFIHYFPFFLTFPARLVAEFPLVRIKPSAAMIMGLGGLSVSIGLSIGLGFGLQPLPRMGIAGLGIAGGVGTTLTAVFFWLHMLNNSTFKNLPFFKLSAIRAQTKQRKSLTHAALINIIAVGSEISAGFALNLLSGLYNVLPAQSIATQYVNLNLLVFTTAFGQVTSQMVAGEIGHARETQSQVAHQRIRQTALAGITATLILESLLALIVIIKPTTFKLLVTSQNSMTPDEETAFRIMAFTSLSQMVGYLALQYLRAAGDNAIASTISSGFLWLGVILAAGLGHIGGQVGIASGFLAGVTIGAFILLCRANKILSAINSDLTGPRIQELTAPDPAGRARRDSTLPLLANTHAPITDALDKKEVSSAPV